MSIPGDPNYMLVRQKRAQALRRGRFPTLKLRAMRAILFNDPYGEREVYCQAEGCPIQDPNDLGVYRKASAPKDNKYGAANLYPRLLKGPTSDYFVACKMHGVRYSGTNGPPPRKDVPNKAKAASVEALALLRELKRIGSIGV